MTPLTRRFLGLVAKVRWPHRVIHGDAGPADPYLLRIYLTPTADWWRKTLGLPGIFLHYFFRGDNDRELHNHPWQWAWSLILTGGYTEFRGTQRGTAPVTVEHIWAYWPLFENFIDGSTFHRVVLQGNGCWTLFVAGPQKPPVMTEDGPKSDWGFIGEDGVTFEHWFERDQRIARERLARSDAGGARNGASSRAPAFEPAVPMSVVFASKARRP